jgi:acetyl-CoA carboxylase biotin carboxyl carrier protein
MKRSPTRKTQAQRTARASAAVSNESSALVEETGLGALATLVDRLGEVLRRHDLGEIEVEEAGRRIRLRRGAEPHAPAPMPMPVPMPMPMHAPPVAPAAAPVAAPAAAAPAGGGGGAISQPQVSTSDGNISYITSPFVGTFYRSPSPDSAPFVDVGTRIKKGQILCIVEAMKLMNEIPSEVDGVIEQILVENGQPVEYGEPLFKIKTT